MMLELVALILCDECGREISDKALECPGCGNPIVGIFPKAWRGRKREASKEGIFLQTLNAGCTIIFLFIGLVVLLAMFGSKK